MFNGYISRKMVTSVIKILVNNIFKKKLIKKKLINILIIFFIFHQNDIKTFLK